MRWRRGKRQCIPIRFCRAKLLTCLPLGHPGLGNAAIMRPISDPIKYVFSRDIRRTRARISLDTGGRLGFPRRDFHVQKSLNPLRCQPMTVSGLTITRTWHQPSHR